MFRKKARKKSGCLNNISTVVIVLLLILLVSSASENAPTTPEPTATKAVSATATATKAPTKKPTTAPTSTPVPTEAPKVMPVIAGSNAYDIVLSLEKFGIEKPSRIKTDDGYSWGSSAILSDGSSIMYDISTNKDHAVGSARFTYSGSNADYHKFCATMPYDAMDSNAAVSFVESLKKEEITTTIGDAIFTIMPTAKGNGAILTIEAIGYEDWLLEKLI